MLPTRPARPAASRFFLLAAWCLLALPKVAAAQAPPPAWELAQSATNSPGTNNTSTISAAAVDARGNVFVTGHFEGSVAFGGTQLTSAGSSDVFVAKWDAVASAFTWATSGGGSGIDEGRGIAVNGPNVYVTGNMGSNGVTRIAGQTLTGAGGYDLFVAKYVDTSTGSTPAISSFANAWATSGGGTSNDMGSGIAVNGAGVFVTGYFSSAAAATIAGQALAGAGSTDLFVAKYVDTSTGITPATSSFANAWATSGGGRSTDMATSIAVNGAGVYVTGFFTSAGGVQISGQVLPEYGSADVFVAKYVDTSTGNTPATSSYANAWATSGGSPDSETSTGIAVSGTGVFITGYFGPGTTRIAGQTLVGLGSADMFVAKYVDTSTGSTPATSSVANAWATSGGGGGYDAGQGIAVRGANVYVTGSFTSGGSARIAGQTLAGAGSFDLFVAKYVDTSTGSTPATSSFANAWVASGGGPGSDVGYAVALSGQRVYATGKAVPPAVFGGVALASAGSGQSALLARLTDPALPLAAAPAASVGARLALYPNPFPGGTATLTGAAPGGAVTVVDALGRAVASARADAAGTAALALPAGLPAGVYLVRAGTQALRLAVE